LSSRLGYTQGALSNYELGKRRLYLANIEQIARELNKPLSYFLEESAISGNSEQGEPQDKAISEIIKLLSELPAEERQYILEYIKWRRDRLQ
jgi:transcriptional regulator with XRE-family HTH domain